MKTVTIPFDLELAKKIQNGEVEGKIVDGEGTNYDVLKWDAYGRFPLVCTFPDNGAYITRTRTFTTKGEYNMEKGNILDLHLEVPEYLAWKEGDYLTIHYDGYPHTYIFIYKSFKANVSNPIKYHALFNVENNCLKIESETILEGDILPSTPSEIAQLTDALFKKGKKWNPETKQVEDVGKKPEHVFKPLDLCLAKFNNMELWTLVQFGYELNGSMVSVGGLTWNKWIPYEGNEHLLGTTKNPEE